MLVPGTRLGPYEILSAIGDGGMGEVYRARDSRLQRIVAIKIIRADLTTDSDFRRRFEREARIVSSLDHPNICTVFDVGREGDKDYLVMEFLDGETLASRLQRGPLPASEVLMIASQLAAALHEAHRRQVVHRDLKPANIMLTSHGAKLMDFGLAKPIVRAMAVSNIGGSDQSTTASVTTPAATTEQGTVIGTFQYLAPEVLRGEPADSRSDLFSFGCVLYEMIAGAPAFNAPSRISLIAAILEKEPEPLAALHPATPPELIAIVNQCLVKNPDQRWQSAADLAHALSWAGRSGDPIGYKSRAPWFRSVLIVSAVLLLAAIAFLRPWNSASPQPLRRYSIVLPASAPVAPAGIMPLGVGRPDLAVSKNGELLVYVGVAGQTKQLFLRTNDGMPPRPIAGTEGAHSPFFSPDSKYLGFFADGKLKKISVAGGPAIALADAVLGFGGCWGQDDFIYYSPGERSPILRIAASGGIPATATPNISDNRILNGAYWPELLPDGNSLLFANSRNGILLYEFASGRNDWLTRSGSSPRWSSTGHILYVDDGLLWALPFDLKRLKVRGTPVLVLDQIQMEQQGAGQFVISEDRTLFHVRGGDVAVATFVWIDRSGNENLLGLPPQRYGEFRLSPDGQTLIFAARDQTRSDLWSYDLQRKTLTRLTDIGFNSAPIWSPDGKKLVHSFADAEGPALVEINPDGSHRRLITRIPGLVKPTWFTPDGTAVLASTNESGSQAIYRIDVASGSRQELERSPHMLVFPSLSPDGRWLAYVSEDSGRWEIDVRPLGRDNQRWRITTNGGEEPIWDRSGRRLYYRNGDEWMRVEIASTPSFHASQPVQVMQGPYVNIPGYSYDVAPDGRFLMLKSEYQDKKASQIEVVENWPALLEKKKP
jgi:serine/threonine protein kinase/Tol biopolymer transport system component